MGLMIALLVFVSVMAALLIWGATRDSRNSDNKKELKALRQMRDTLFDLAVNSVEVEPFAAVVIDEIRKTNKELES